MTGLRSRKKLIRQFVFMILVLQVAVNELVNSSSSPPTPTYEWPAIEWACRPLLLGLGGDSGITTNNKYDIDAELHLLQQKTIELCLKIRGGRLGGGRGGSKESTAAVLDRPSSSSSTTLSNNETHARTTLIEKSEGDDETVSTLSLSVEERYYEEDDYDVVEDDSISIEITESSELPSTPVPDEKQSVMNRPPQAVLDAYSFSFYQKNDGSESDPDRIPRKYLKMQNGKRGAAKKAMKATLEWRKEHDIDTILARPHPKFDVCNKVFPHYFCGRDESNHVVLLQRPGLIDLPTGHANGLTGEDLLFHYVYEMEYLWQIVEPDPDATMTSVIDLTGLNFAVLRRAELINVVKLFVTTLDAHFPLRSHRTLVINSPKWFGAMYKLVSPLLRESTKQKIQILSKGKKQDEAMQSLLSNCPIPTGKNKRDEIPPSEMETEMRNFVSFHVVCVEPEDDVLFDSCLFVCLCTWCIVQ
jgi:CRAL/TRIO domain